MTGFSNMFFLPAAKPKGLVEVKILLSFFLCFMEVLESSNNEGPKILKSTPPFPLISAASLLGHLDIKTFKFSHAELETFTLVQYSR